MNTHISKKTKLKIYTFNENKSMGTYYVNPTCELYKYCKEFYFVGFKKLPKGFSTDGFGFASPATFYLTKHLLENFGNNVLFTVTKSIKSVARKYGKIFHVTINHSDYLRILETLRLFRFEKNLKTNEHIANVLGEIYPKYCKIGKEVKTIYSYENDKITKILGSDENAYEKLSKADVETIAKIHSKLVKTNKFKFTTIAIAEESKKLNERIYLKSVVDEFEKRMKNASLSESDWQRFLQKYILLFNTSYVKSIEKLSVDLRGKYPDFMLVNVYGYIDIFEIKKPSTNLLKHDDSRDNYFWDVEITKAITQTEKYVQMLIKKELDVKDIIEEKHKTTVKVVRPRGFIVVGNSNQFENKKKEDDFRLLASSLKNVDIVLYDELLNNLKNLLKRLK